MKVVHNSAKPLRPDDAMENAKMFEHDGDLGKAADIYERLIKIEPLNEQAYDRLMIIYRKEKDYKKEHSTISAGIKAFEDHYHSSSKLTSNKKISDLSLALLKFTGLADKKGKLLYEPEPIARWRKRKLLVEKKLDK